MTRRFERSSRLRILTSILALVFALLFLACATGDRGVSTPGELPVGGALAVEISPNPIIARNVAGDTYDFPFEVRISNPGTLPVAIDRVTMDVVAVGGVRVYSTSMTAAEIARRGYPTQVGAGETLRYQFSPRENVDDERLFSAVSAEIQAVGRDTAGKTVTARTSVSVRRG